MPLLPLELIACVLDMLDPLRDRAALVQAAQSSRALHMLATWRVYSDLSLLPIRALVQMLNALCAGPAPPSICDHPYTIIARRLRRITIPDRDVLFALLQLQASTSATDSAAHTDNSQSSAFPSLEAVSLLYSAIRAVPCTPKPNRTIPVGIPIELEPGLMQPSVLSLCICLAPSVVRPIGSHIPLDSPRFAHNYPMAGEVYVHSFPQRSDASGCIYVHKHELGGIAAHGTASFVVAFTSLRCGRPSSVIDRAAMLELRCAQIAQHVLDCTEGSPVQHAERRLTYLDPLALPRVERVEVRDAAVDAEDLREMREDLREILKDKMDMVRLVSPDDEGFDEVCRACNGQMIMG